MSKQQIAEGRNWYVIHTYAGYENAVQRNLKQRIESLGMEDKIFDVIVPTEKKIKIKAGKRVEEEEKILAVAPPFLRALVVLILETGMRSHREALALKWEAINFENASIRVRESKTRAGIRDIPLTTRCKAELLHWREQLGQHFSPICGRPSNRGMTFDMLGQELWKRQGFPTSGSTT